MDILFIMFCKICQSTEISYEKYDNHTFSFKTFLKKYLHYIDFLIPKSNIILKKYSTKKTPFRGKVLHCSTCGYAELINKPSDIELINYYSNEYWSQISDDHSQSSTGNYNTDIRSSKQFEFITQHVNGDNLNIILEVGGGASYGSLYFKEQFKHLQLDICEPGKQWEKYYIDNNMNKVADFFPFHSDKNYDLIITSHWLEHVIDLNETIVKLKDMIKGGGNVFVEVPNTEHYYWSLPIIDTPHIHFFTKDSLIRVFNNHGLECLGVEECGVSFLDSMTLKTIPDDKFGQSDKGFWLRALFKKNEVSGDAK